MFRKSFYTHMCLDPHLFLYHTDFFGRLAVDLSQGSPVGQVASKIEGVTKHGGKHAP